MENQEFVIDLYGYRNYNWEELTEDFLNEWDYIGVDYSLSTDKNWCLHDHVKKSVEYLEKNWTLITEFFIKQRVLRNNPIFKHIMNWGKIKISLI